MVPRMSVGPDLRQFFLGAEGTTGVVVEVALRIFPRAEWRHVESLRFESVEAGVEAMRLVMRGGLRPFLVRFYDEDEAPHAMQDAAFKGCAMFIGVEGVAPIAAAEFEVAMRICEAGGGQRLGPAAAESWLGRRFDFSTIENRLAIPGGFAETIEVAHFWDQALDLYGAMKVALAPLAGAGPHRSLGAVLELVPASGTIIGITRGTSREHLVRATLEGIVFSTRTSSRRCARNPASASARSRSMAEPPATTS